MMLAPQMMSEKIRIKEMVVSRSACVPLPVSPKVWEMIMAMAKLRAAASILVPKVFRIFLNTGLSLTLIERKNTKFSVMPTNFNATLIG